MPITIPFKARKITNLLCMDMRVNALRRFGLAELTELYR